MQVRNHVTLIGHLGKDPELRTFDNGTSVVNFSLATNHTYRNKQGEKVTQTEWHRLTAFGKAAENLAKYLRKGSQVCVSGELRSSKWVDKFEQNRSTVEIVVRDYTFLDGKREGAVAERRQELV